MSKIRNQNSNELFGDLCINPHLPSTAAPVPLQKPSFTLACAILPLPPNAFLPAFWGPRCCLGRAGRGGGGRRVEKGGRRGSAKETHSQHAANSTSARPCGPAPRPATAWLASSMRPSSVAMPLMARTRSPTCSQSTPGAGESGGPAPKPATGGAGAGPGPAHVRAGRGRRGQGRGPGERGGAEGGARAGGAGSAPPRR